MPHLNPYTNTRQEFTNVALNRQPVPPADADPKWVELEQTLKLLLTKIIDHPAMSENKNQTFMTPAISKNRVYFMWDSVGRLLPRLYEVPCQLEASPNWSPQDAEEWQVECVGKANYLAQLILDNPPGAFNKMIEVLYPDQAGRHPDFGDEIKQLAQRILDFSA